MDVLNLHNVFRQSSGKCTRNLDRSDAPSNTQTSVQDIKSPRWCQITSFIGYSAGLFIMALITTEWKIPSILYGLPKIYLTVFSYKFYTIYCK